MLKLLDYGEANPFGAIFGKARHLVWPVNAYRVTLPSAANSGGGLNPFERVVLKLLDAVGKMDEHALAKETRIPVDLVKGILLRLRDKALIDEHNAIVERMFGGDVKDDAPSFATALVFRELGTGKILPFLHWLDEENRLRTKDGKEDFQIRWDNAQRNKPIENRDVIKALRAMTKRSPTAGGNVKLTDVRQITIARQPELYHLDCPIAIQKNDAEYRIADPFGNGFSLVLESAFRQLLEQDDKLENWLREWKQSLSNPINRDAKPGEPFDTDANQRRYPKLIARLRPSRNESFRSIEQIHAAIEWAFFYVCCRYPFNEAVDKLKFSEPPTQTALLEDAARKIGLTPPKYGFKPIRKGKLLDFRNEKAELGTVLAIAILQAESDESHPLRRLASTHRDPIDRLLDIKKKRDEKAHGKGGADAQKLELPDDPFMREVVHTLLPDIAFSDTPAPETNEDAFADSLLDARASIQSEFTFKVFNCLGANVQNRLIHAESFWLSCENGDDALEFVSDLYAALQSEFDKRLSGRLPPDIEDSELIHAVEKKAAETGLRKELPECLRTVKPLAIRQTLQGAGQTLGSCAIAFLLVSDDNSLHAIADLQPSFVNDIANVIIKRSHGNQPLPLQKTDMTELRKASYSTIKTLIEA
jgi:hypothetical protein